MFLLRGFIFCNGRKDITKPDIHKNVHVEILDDTATWRDCKIISSSVDLNAKPILNGNELLFDFDLLKNEDFIYFEALGESKTTLYDIRHRIVNVPAVEQDKIHSFQFPKKKLYREVFFMLMLIFICTQFSLISLQINKWDFKKIYYNSKGETIPKDSIDSINQARVAAIEKVKDSTLEETRWIFDYVIDKKAGKFALPGNYKVEYVFDSNMRIYFTSTLWLMGLIYLGTHISSIIFFLKKKRFIKIITKEIIRSAQQGH
jgi:hypothetical protein